MSNPEPQIEIDPLDIIELEAALEPFCPVAVEGGQYHPGMCLPWCNVCASLLIKNKETP